MAWPIPSLSERIVNQIAVDFTSLYWPDRSTFALTNATLPYALKLANRGFLDAINSDSGLKEGVNTYAGHCTYEAVASAQGISYTTLDQLLRDAVPA